jgi:hypothetical protein
MAKLKLSKLARLCFLIRPYTTQAKMSNFEGRDFFSSLGHYSDGNAYSIG